MRSGHDRNRRKASAFFELALSIALNSAAMILLRAVVGAISTGSGEVSLGLLMQALSNWLFWAGGLCFVGGIYFWVQALKEMPLSLAYPTSAISYIVIAPLAWILFGEPITITRAVGMSIIIIGVAMLYRRGEAGKP